jgi:hypothetical protein
VVFAAVSLCGTASARDVDFNNGSLPDLISVSQAAELSGPGTVYAAGCNGGDFDSANDFIVPKGQPLYSACPCSCGHGKCSAALPPAAEYLSPGWTIPPGGCWASTWPRCGACKRGFFPVPGPPGVIFADAG